MKTHRLLLSTLLILAASSVFFAQSSVKIGSPAPAFSGTYLDGSPFELDHLRGSVVVISFWSTRCAICHNERPKLNLLADQYDRGKVVFLALSTENEQKIAAYLRHNPFRFQVLPNSFGALLAYADRDRAGNINMGFPAFYVVDQQGIVQYRASGYDKTDSLNAAIMQLTSK